MKFICKDILIICFAIALITSSSCAQQNLNKETSLLTQNYIDDYINMKFEKLSKYYNAVSVFQDPTLVIIDENAAQKVIGKKAILEKLMRNFKGITNQKYTLDNHYQVGPYSIYSGLYEYTQNAKSFGGPDILIQFSLKSTTILKEDNGKITEHIEYMDYTSWFQQFNAQTKR